MEAQMTTAAIDPLTTDLFSVRGKVALVTGGSRGIGLMIARGLVESGVRVYISSRKAQVCDEVAQELSAAGECVSLPANVGEDAGARGLAAALREREEKLHILVNNAGATWGAPLEDYPESGFDKLWAVNVKGPFRLTTELLPALRAAATPDDPARVINIGSIAGHTAGRGDAWAYGPTKAAIHQLTRHLAARLTDDNITVNAVAPGPFESKMMAYVLDDPEGRKAVEQGIPLGRIGAPADAAGATIFLCSRAGAYLTGAVLPLDGGASSLGRPA
jgi:NAD(P)-dependent dehydrogenase (short-subunit alcohol dehydrogenase family)